MGDSHADVSKHVRVYLAIFGGLALFTVLTVIASRVHVSTTLHILIALAIATLKASMVAAVFMHLWWEKGKSIWWTLLLCAAFFAALMLLPSLTVFELPPQAQFGTWD
jgi:caa(3)-type oxidase subunit IV